MDMNRPPFARPALAVTIAQVVALSAIALPATVTANELGGSIRPSRFVIHDAAETLREYCHADGDRLVFTLPGGASWELVTTVTDPAIANPGDGQFHPFSAPEVQRALDQVMFPMQRVAAEVFVLPYPRRLQLDSAAGPGVILLSPGVRALSLEQQHAEFVHELGHVVQYALMPDADTLAWSRYRALRGLRDARVYSAAAAHCDRPHEIFAEDFRALYGDAYATYSGSIENAALAYPTRVPGLGTFVEALASAPVAATPLRVVAATAGGAVLLARNGAGAAVLDLYDVRGRRVASVVPSVDAGGCQWSWDGREAGAARGATVLFARARDGLGGSAKIVWRP
jgi:hypothetical protein